LGRDDPEKPEGTDNTFSIREVAARRCFIRRPGKKFHRKTLSTEKRGEISETEGITNQLAELIFRVEGIKYVNEEGGLKCA